jgi:hypothetical protein
MFVTAMQESCTLITLDTVRKEVEILFLYWSLRDEVRSFEVSNISVLINEWRQRNDSVVYPWFLCALFNAGFKNQELVDETITHLTGRDPRGDSYNGYLLLSIFLLEYYMDDILDERMSIPFDYLYKAMARWKSRLNTEVCIMAYSQLARFDIENEEYYKLQIGNWELIRLHRDHLARVVPLINKGHYFLIFKDYFTSIRHWGIRTDMNINTLMSELHCTDAKKLQTVNDWFDNDNNIPDAVIHTEEGALIQSSFLIIGSYVFSAPCDKIARFNETRKKFDKKSKAAVRLLLHIIDSLPRLPSPIKDLLAEYSERYYKYTMPQ